ncbi:hypothetical protein CAFE_27570 [Caprobacter fermentans]|uniref:DUF2620 family protein n=1 Tax=Caproicibacter fermentans TaxID=2576756 RepID=A0A6N8I268_9FIRM|nr:DUF2620 family protein [Caproicibacter fermentans]MVB12028.1 hypothetical protein [Caproicibacter fermentans]OCN03036.1 hypothetical protein A7X67_03860 [Clostridium sp. W14A]QNK40626.1 DUF2620 family protein [Caproicibacter fermentans]
MKIAIGGLSKNVVAAAVEKASGGKIETVVTTDIGAVSLLKKKEVDYYFGACESGGGAAISILIGMIGYSNCCTVTKNGQTVKKENVEKFVNEGKIAFGMSVESIEKTVPLLVEALLEKNAN